MFPVPSGANTLLEQGTSITYKSKCLFEYNMNSMVDNITVTGAQVTKTDAAGNTYQPFKKLFPVDSIVKPFRPNGAGIKYAISGDVDSGWRSPKSLTYTPNFRIYYPGPDTFYKYYVSALGTGIDVTINYPKTILTNKIVARFELSHSTPATWTIFGNGTQLATGNSSSIISFETGGSKNYNAGTVTIYYNGTSWSTTEPSSPAAPVSLTSVKLTTSAVSGKYVGLIELSPRWVVDVSESLVSFEIQKESSTSTEDLMPVGNISANSISLNMISYEADRKIITYNKSEEFDASKIYLYKQIQVVPYIKMYNAGGAKNDSDGNYDEILQGTFYVDFWDTEEFGEISINALDGAKILQETIAPGIVCEGYAITAIIRRLLDSVGFTNYRIYINDTDSSIFAPRYWWTDNTKTVWDALQELCRDAQITAVFSYDNVLKFYSREYLFNLTRGVDWTLRYDASGSNLPNIVSLSKKDLPAANQFKVFWKSVSTSNYVESSQDIWKSDPYYLGAFSLDQNLPSTVGAGSYMALSPCVINEEELGIAAYEFSGYFIIDSEIIEYDAIQYQYTDISGNLQKVDIENRTDLLKYTGLGQSDVNNYKPSGFYRIKTRGAFNTPVDNHYAAADSIIAQWSGYQVNVK